MQLSNIEILNLWEKDKITLNFENRVTFLTGINGSGKSTLLNIIYDTLNLTSDGRRPSTSKNRFWSAQVEFDNKCKCYSMLLPDVDKKTNVIEKVDNLLKEKISFHDIAFIKEIQSLYNESEESNIAINHISYSGKLTGEYNVKTFSLPEGVMENKRVTSSLSNSLAFLYQEDRTTLHNVEKSNIDLSLDYWGIYRSSIDDKFAYSRDAVQIAESLINQKAREILDNNGPEDFDKLINSSEYKRVISKSNEIKRLIAKLNEYFKDSGKELTRDSENKLTLRKIGNDKHISWHLLSRGEKTLLYMFFVVFMYRDKVEIFLFDEPEIALHVKWQKNLIRDLSEVAPNNQFIIATHSPSLVMNGWLGHCLEISEA